MNTTPKITAPQLPTFTRVYLVLTGVRPRKRRTERAKFLVLDKYEGQGGFDGPAYLRMLAARHLVEVRHEFRQVLAAAVSVVAGCTESEFKDSAGQVQRMIWEPIFPSGGFKIGLNTDGTPTALALNGYAEPEVKSLPAPAPNPA